MNLHALKLTRIHGPTVRESLKDQIEHSEQEARMVLPGIEALFGFQLIAIFNSTFKSLPQHLQNIHLAALICSAISVIFVLTPAAYHRLAEEGKVSSFFARLSSVLLGLSLIPMMCGTILDVFVLSVVVTGSKTIAWWVSAPLFVVNATLWIVFPLVFRARR